MIGGGHAGCEAAWALGRRGHAVAVVSLDVGGLACMSCNPAIGGLAKGQLVREIDALGGLMGRLADRAGIHFRMLNLRKGPAVRAPRAQADKALYSEMAVRALAALSSVTFIEGEVTEIVTEVSAEIAAGAVTAIAPEVPGEFATRVPGDAGGTGAVRVLGVRLEAPDWSLVRPGGAHSAGRAPAHCSPDAFRVTEPLEIEARIVILTAGTFLGGCLFTGMDPRPGGRRGEPPARALSARLRAMGLRLGRLKTGTPPRLAGDSIDCTRLEVQPGDEPPPRFSFFEETPVRNQTVCHLTRTQPRTHEIIRAALDRSPLYGGLIRGIGPRYCPSIEDKIVRFPERASHQVFLEPEGLNGETVYPNGISTSLPADVQEAYVRSIPGLEEARIVHPGYAVEYDFLHTAQIDSRLKVRGFDGLYAAGQVNGTSGYEEAAAQGLVAGLNACADREGRPPFLLRRDEAYIGVLIDDLITKSPEEPYRMFTSQSEYRLLLRQDNADQRLSRLGWERGLLGKEEMERVATRWAALERERERLRVEKVSGFHPPLTASDVGKSLEEVLRRPEVSLALLEESHRPRIPVEDFASLEADIKYEGYLPRLRKEIRERESIEQLIVPECIIDNPPVGLSREAQEKLRERRPRTLGQASRVPGITPCDVSILLVRIVAGNREAEGTRANEQAGKGSQR